MRFSGLRLQFFRNIREADLQFFHKFTVFCGANGSGKTSVLEALYFLAHARSFRTSVLRNLIGYAGQAFIVYADLSDGVRTIPLGVERDRSGKQLLRFDGESGVAIGHIASALPLVFLDTDAHRNFAASPQARRQFLDWGVFHVKHGFWRDWQQYQKCLKQRNALLRQGVSGPPLLAWTEQLAQVGERLDAARMSYITDFDAVLQVVWADLMPDLGVPVLHYTRGWGDGALLTSMHDYEEQDLRYGYTARGPHRCDFKVLVAGRDITEFFSQGQQKSAMYALKVAQGVFLKQVSGRQVIYLIDDIPAELDSGRLSSVLLLLNQYAEQVFVTAIDRAAVESVLGDYAAKVYNVHNGVITG